MSGPVGEHWLSVEEGDEIRRISPGRNRKEDRETKREGNPGKDESERREDKDED